jgi:hypothetical protein
MSDEIPMIPSMTDPDEPVEPGPPMYTPVYRSDDLSTTFIDAGPPAAFTATPAAPPPAGTVPAPAGARDRVTCPECGAVQDVYLNRRDAVDFCHNCDFPLFWTPSEVIRDRGPGDGDALRRLPGTVGRTTLASTACPHCSELNLVSAQVCIRCGLPMHPVAELPPPPEPVYVPPPPPVVAPEPERGVPWWVWVLGGVALAAIIVVVILVLTNVIN